MSATAAAWVQAIGSIAAILVAVAVPWWQRRAALRDSAINRARQEREHLKRLCAALREEIRAASAAAEMRQTAIDETFEQLEQARQMGAIIKESGPIQVGSLTLSDATIYTQLAAELGQFPPPLIKSIVSFYSLTIDIGRQADGAPTAIEAYVNIRSSLPRVRTYAAMLVRSLEKFEEADFAGSADTNPMPSEIRKFAAAAGYPLDEIAESRGVKLPQ